MKIKLFEPPLPDLDMIETEPAQMNNGGDVDLEAYKRNNSIVEPRKMFFGGVIERLRNQAAEAAADGQLNEEELAAFNNMYGPSASEAAGFNPVATMAGGFDDLPIRVQEQLRADLGEVAERASTGMTQEERDALTEAALQADRAEAAEQLQFQLERNEYVDALTPGEIDLIVKGGNLTPEQATLLTQNYQVTEDQLAELFAQGLLTEDQIRAVVEGEVAEQVEESESSAEGIAAGLTEEQINELITQGLANQDMTGYATQEDIQGLESLFQNYLTPEQLEGYLPQDQAETITALEKKIADLEQQYGDVQSQYEADAVNQQISDAKQEVQNYYAASAPTGPRTGSTSQFDSGISFLPGASPMASLIGSQREGQGQDAFTSYLKTFTPSYGDYNEPFSPEEYNERNQPFMGGMYNNPFTGGMSYNPDKRNMGGQVSNGIMDLTNFDTNVQPFQNAFRPNVPRN